MNARRQIVLDTETTGLEWRNGHRIIEIGCVELVNRTPTGRHYHTYLNPERPVDAGAIAVHGINNEFLADKPRFSDVVEEFEEFVRDAELVIHNANFDVGFLNQELGLLQRPKLDSLCAGVVDTLRLAKDQNPGKKASLDALCDRHGVSNSHRTLHGALLDAELLAEVYLAMTRGQESLIMPLDVVIPETLIEASSSSTAPERLQTPIKLCLASGEEMAAHSRALEEIALANKGYCLWGQE